ncbi:MAG TPA: DUF1704 domain-containing protein [bacterium]|nr:DUF1704 domain-containing protein [bacterium]
MYKLAIKQFLNLNENENAVTTAPALDEQWYDILEKYGSFQIYEFFESDLNNASQQKRLFDQNVLLNPKPKYPFLQKRKLQIFKVGLNKLKKQIRKAENNSLIKQVYIDKINEKLIEIKLLEAALNLSHSRNKNEENKFARQFKIYSQQIYGKPSKKLFYFAVTKVRRITEKNLNNNGYTQLVGNKLLEILPGGDKNKMNDILKKTDVEKFIAKYLMLDDILKELHLPKKNIVLDAKKIKKYFEILLDKLNIDDWEVKITNKGSAINVDHDKEQILIPKKRKLNRDKLRLLMVHEIGVHVRRRVNGENKALKILGLGLNNYETAEEGLAGICEDLVKKAHDITFGALLSYLAIGLVYGLDGKKRDFRDLYEILVKIYQFKYVLHFDESSTINWQEIDEKAKDRAWQKCRRIFRGTNCRVKGVCITKDIIYLKGRIQIWKQITNDDPEIMRIFSAKYDPINAEHIKVLDKLGVA